MKYLNTLAESIQKHSPMNAFIIEGKAYTYSELAQAISNVRQVIRQNIEATENLIGLVTNDDLETYATIFALWLEGKAYVPVNPLYPIERNLQILELTESKYVIDSLNSKEYEEVHKALPSSDIQNVEINLIPNTIDPANLAYILFTSGSTGIPKGVPITFENLNALMQALDTDPLFNLTASDKCLQMFELTFDFSLVTYLPPLLYGACVYTIPKDTIKYFYIFKLINNHGLTVLTMVPSIIHYLRPYFKEIRSEHVRYCSFGGGKLHADIADEWSQCIPKAEIFNYYGPTEYTVYTGYYPYIRNQNTKHHNGVISIGKTLAGVHYLIVDEQNKEVPIGVTGELCLAGVQLTPGYWKNEKKNQESFFFRRENDKEVRYYKTGDLCYLDDEGDYMYVGRADFQVKIRGYRVELAEIEFYAKKKIPKKEIVALDVANELGNTELVLAIVSEEFDMNEVLDFMKEKLPIYMVPTQIKFVKEFPHSLNGKIDRQKLKSYFK